MSCLVSSLLHETRSTLTTCWPWEQQEKNQKMRRKRPAPTRPSSGTTKTLSHSASGKLMRWRWHMAYGMFDVPRCIFHNYSVSHVEIDGNN